MGKIRRQLPDAYGFPGFVAVGSNRSNESIRKDLRWEREVAFGRVRWFKLMR